MSTEKKTRLNENIDVKEVRLIDENGQQVGVISIGEALKKAEDAGLDLVEIVPNVKPPVCKIINYGKYVFQQNKKQAMAKKKQKRIQIKKIRIRSTIEEGDYQVKIRNLRKFLEEGNKVEVSLRFRGRELAHREFGINVLKRLQEDLADYAEVERQPSFQDRQLMAVFVPKKTK